MTTPAVCARFVDGSSRELMMEASIIYGSIKCWIFSITYILLVSISHDKCIVVILIYHWTTSCRLAADSQMHSEMFSDDSIILTQCTYTISAVALIILLGS